MEYTPTGMILELTTLVEIVTDSIGSCKLPYNHDGPVPPKKGKM
jgi:hypothetical protein